MSDGMDVDWGRKEDEHAESIVRIEAESPEGWPTRHLQWPAPKLPEPHPSLAASIDGKLVGRTYLEAICPPFAELQNMLVLPQFRGRGAGGALVDKCLSYLAQNGFLGVFLQTDLGNTSAQRLYAR